MGYGVILYKNNMRKSFYIVHDCETGGLDETQNPITQYAAIVLDPFTLKEVDRWETFIKPYAGLKLEQQALDKTFVNIADINAGCSRQEFVNTAIKFWGQYQVKSKYKDEGRAVSVGHNVVFDHRFLGFVCELHNRQFHDYFHDTFVDTFPLSKMCWGLKGVEKLNLTASCENAKLNITDAHEAMNDVEATADLFRFFTRKFRSKGGTDKSETNGRAKGKNFFEFKCSN